VQFFSGPLCTFHNDDDNDNDDDDDDDDGMCSVMAQKLVELAIDVMQEAVVTHSSENIAVNGHASDGPTENGDISDEHSHGREMSVQLFYTARSIFEMFASVVPVYHHQQLSTVPQLSGILSLFTSRLQLQ